MFYLDLSNIYFRNVLVEGKDESVHKATLELDKATLESIDKATLETIDKAMDRNGISDQLNIWIWITQPERPNSIKSSYNYHPIPSCIRGKKIRHALKNIRPPYGWKTVALWVGKNSVW